MKKFFIILLYALLTFVLTYACTGKSASRINQAQSLEALELTAAEEEQKAPQIDHSWQFDKPENRGINPLALARFHAVLDGHNIYAVVMAKDGFIIDEYYKTGYNENSLLRFASVTKSVTGAVVGLAIDQGYIKNVNATLDEFFPQLDDPRMERKRKITVENLLTNTSGIYWNEWAGGDYFMRLNRSDNWVEFILSQNMQYEPGAVFNYTTGGFHLLGEVIQKATGMSEFEFAKKTLFDPLGMSSVVWRSDPQGITDGGNGISMTGRDAAKFGQLYLDGGRYKDKQIISEDWIKISVRHQVNTGSPNSGNYGYGWWLKSFAGYDGYYAMGAGGQYIIVVPQLKLVTVMSGRITNAYTPQNLFRDHLKSLLE